MWTPKNLLVENPKIIAQQVRVEVTIKGELTSSEISHLHYHLLGSHFSLLANQKSVNPAL
jgi:hypothetical protein